MASLTVAATCASSSQVFPSGEYHVHEGILTPYCFSPLLEAHEHVVVQQIHQFADIACPGARVAE